MRGTKVTKKREIEGDLVYNSRLVAKLTNYIMKDGKKTINISEEIGLSNCEQGWKCVEAKYRAYQFSNCSWTSIEFCVYGCKNGLCNPPPICKLNSLKCDNDNVVKCEDGYEWKMNESCDYQCQNGICPRRSSRESS